MWSRPVSRIVGSGLVALALTLPAAGAALADDASPATPGPQRLTLVTLQGPGTAAGTRDAAELLARQDTLLAAIGATEPVYRWTTALNGFAAELSEAQVAVLDDQPGIATIEADRVRPLAGRTSMATVRGAATSPRLRGGAGVVIGVVDSGIAPQSPAFAEVPGLGRDPRDFAGTCAEGDGWSAEDCTRKVVGARWFVDGFGADRVRSSESLSRARRPRPRHPGVLGRRRQRRPQRPGRRPGRRPGSAASRPRRGSPPTRRAGVPPIPSTTAARRQTWSPRSTPPSPTGSTS